MVLGERLEVPRSMEEPWVSLSDRHKQGMWTFFEYCVTRRCCYWYVDLRCGIQKGGCRGWGDVNVHGIASPEVVVTLKMLSRWKFWYVEDVELLLRWTCCCYLEGALTLKMLARWKFWYVEDVELLLRWTCCCYLEGALTLKMLLRWWCWWFWYVEDVVMLKMLKLLSKRHCGCEE